MVPVAHLEAATAVQSFNLIAPLYSGMALICPVQYRLDCRQYARSSCNAAPHDVIFPTPTATGRCSAVQSMQPRIPQRPLRTWPVALQVEHQQTLLHTFLLHLGRQDSPGPRSPLAPLTFSSVGAARPHPPVHFNLKIFSRISLFISPVYEYYDAGVVDAFASARLPSRAGPVGVLFASTTVSHWRGGGKEEKKVTMYGYAMLPNRRGSEALPRFEWTVSGAKGSPSKVSLQQLPIPIGGVGDARRLSRPCQLPEPQDSS
ncbi:uncharacterized protein PG986_011822 [Apiospora aurea]|uniref:Uncharacterized protein n=1 Tax=Apiospora aurea TaxID=335848 RepID=A0ABR1PY75_9PEZI